MNLKPARGNPQLVWCKSSYSTPDGAACIEVAITPATIHIRDSKHALGPQLAIAPQSWATFVSYAADH
ncbi:DUF397 domain-containing protein [Streptomyces sp. NPDC002758]